MTLFEGLCYTGHAQVEAICFSPWGAAARAVAAAAKVNGSETIRRGWPCCHPLHYLKEA